MGLAAGRALAVLGGATGRGAGASCLDSASGGCSAGAAGGGAACVSGKARELARDDSLVSLATVPTSTLLVDQASAAEMGGGLLGFALERAAQPPTSSACSAIEASNAQGKESRDVRLTLASVLTSSQPPGFLTATKLAPATFFQPFSRPVAGLHTSAQP